MKRLDRSITGTRKQSTPVFFKYKNDQDLTIEGSFHYDEGNVPYLYGMNRSYGFINGELTNKEEIEGYTYKKEPFADRLDFNFFVSEEALDREIKWDYRHLEHATWYGNRLSKDPSTKVGAVITDPFDQTVVSLGFNGFARGVSDHRESYLDRDKKYPRIIHAEMNAIMTAKIPLRGMSIYTSSLSPCMRCASCIIQSGIKKVVFYDVIVPERWKAEMEESIDMMQNAGVTVYSLPTISVVKQEFIIKEEKDSCC